MGAAPPHSPNTRQIVTWISKLKCKRTALKRQRRKNLLAEAIVTSLLCRAENDLQAKRNQRLDRWRQIKDSMDPLPQHPAPPPTIDEDLISLDNFMSQLKKAKVPAEQR